MNNLFQQLCVFHSIIKRRINEQVADTIGGGCTHATLHNIAENETMVLPAPPVQAGTNPRSQSTQHRSRTEGSRPNPFWRKKDGSRACPVFWLSSEI